MWSVFISGVAVSIVKKPDGTLVVGVRFTLKSGRYDELIAFVLGASVLAPTIREAIHRGVVKRMYMQLELDLNGLEGVGIVLLGVTSPRHPRPMSHRNSRNVFQALRVFLLCNIS
jgi:hypothetical protein